MQQTFTRIIFSISCPRGPKRFSVVLYQDCLDFKSQGTKIKNKNKIPETIGWYGILQNSAYILPSMEDCPSRAPPKLRFLYLILSLALAAPWVIVDLDCLWWCAKSSIIGAVPEGYADGALQSMVEGIVIHHKLVE
jgi:hypothetical protein